MNNIKTEQKLLDALDRILKKSPVNISKNRKLSFSSVEDEALLSRSLSRHYPEVFEKIKEAINNNKNKNIFDNDSEDLVNEDLKNENRILKEQIKLLQKEKDELIVTNISLAERVVFLNNNIKGNKDG